MNETVSKKTVVAKLIGSRSFEKDENGEASAIPMFKNLSVMIASNAALNRQTTYAIGREVGTIERVSFVAIDDDGKEIEVASATCDTKQWHVTFADGEKHEPAVVTLDRSEARKPGEKWEDVPLEAGGRDLGPDMHVLAHSTLGELGLIEKQQRGETTSLKETVATQDSAIAALIKTLTDMGMAPEQINAITGAAAAETAEKLAAAKAEKAAKKAAKPASK